LEEALLCHNCTQMTVIDRIVVVIKKLYIPELCNECWANTPLLDNFKIVYNTAGYKLLTKAALV
jgi:predicted amidophosphoribosyltransferase